MVVVGYQRLRLRSKSSQLTVPLLQISPRSADNVMMSRHCRGENKEDIFEDGVYVGPSDVRVTVRIT